MLRLLAGAAAPVERLYGRRALRPRLQPAEARPLAVSIGEAGAQAGGGEGGRQMGGDGGLAAATLGVGDEDSDHAVSFPGACSRTRSEEHTSELQSLMRISYAVFCLKKKKYYYNTQF